MGEDILVSVIVPVYNVEGFIQRTLDSVRDQTYRNIEVVMVDDGSTDGSADICKAMEASDSRFRYVHKENGGLSSARNHGMKQSGGSYVTFLDGDDLLAPMAVEVMLSLALEYDVELVSCAYGKIAAGETFSGVMSTDAYVCTSEEHLKKMFTLDGETGSACSKLFAKSLFQYLVFPDGQLFEDLGVVAHLIDKAGKTVVSNAELYGYVTRSGSITGKAAYGPKHVEDMEASLSVMRSLLDRYPGIRSSFECIEAFSYVRVASRLSEDLCPSKQYYADYLAHAKKAALAAASNPSAGKVWRFRCRLFSVSMVVHNALYSLYGRVTGKVVG